METDARGQLGGLETTDAVRQRLAIESTSFRCTTCGKTNEEIIKECQERSQDGMSSQQEVEIPSELSMGWRDELDAKSQNENPSANGEHESPELAEGFVQTAPKPANEPTPSLPPYPVRDTRIPTPPQDHQPPPLRYQDDTEIPMPPPPQIALAQPRQAQDDGVPLWIDRTIVVLVVLLAALVLKILFAL